MTLALCRYLNAKNRRLKRLLNCGIVWPVCSLGVRGRMEGLLAFDREGFDRTLNLGPCGLLDIVHYASIIETAAGSHVCTPMRVENLAARGWAQAQPRSYYPIEKRPNQGRFEAVIYAPDWTRTSTPLRAQALNLLCIPIPPRGHIMIIHPSSRFCQQCSSANFALGG